jgi:ABC-type transport system substrate-binding protein
VCDPDRIPIAAKTLQRMRLVDEAVDHPSVAEAASRGVLAATRAVLARCEALGVEDVTLAEAVRSWTEVMAADIGREGRLRGRFLKWRREEIVRKRRSIPPNPVDCRLSTVDSRYSAVDLPARGGRRVQPMLWTKFKCALTAAACTVFIGTASSFVAMGVTYAAGPRWGGTINVSFAEDATTLDPAVCYDSVCWGAMEMMFNRLYDYYRNTNRLIPEAAAAMPVVSDGGKVYTITLRRGMRFWNGQEVTARDVVYSLDRILNPKTQSPVMGFWTGVLGASQGASGSVPGIQAVGPYTVRITLTAPNRAFPYILAMPQASIIPYGAAASPSFARHPIGSGPFEFKSWQPGQALIFVRNPHYWAAPRPYADEVYFHLDMNPNVALLNLEKGSIQILGDGIPSSQFLSVVNNPKYKSLLSTRNLESTYFLTMNVQMKPFNDVRVRKAVALALDRPYLLKLIHGQGQLANELIPPGVDGYAPLPPIQRNLDEARKLLAAAGYKSGFSTTLYSWNTDPWTELDAAVAQELGQIGIHVQVRAIAENAFFGLASTPKTAPMTLAFWIADFPEASDFFNALFSCASAVKGGQNYSFYCNPKVDAYVTKALAATSDAEATADYTQADKLLMADMPMVPLFHTTYTSIHGAALGGYFPNPVWGDMYDYYWLKNGSSKPPKS